MTERRIDLATWPRAAQFRLFRGYARPHFAITTRLDVSRVIARRAQGLSPYCACMHAVGAGLQAEPAMRTRFRGDTVIEHDRVALSVTVPAETGFVYADLDWHADLATFDRDARAAMQAARARGTLGANDGSRRDDVAYLSCTPWLDFTALDNPLPSPDDCIPRIAWGRFTPRAGGGHDMAVSVQVHHATVDGAHVGAFVAAMQAALTAL